MQTINTSDSNQEYLTTEIHSISSGTLTAQSQERGESHAPSCGLGNESRCWGYLAGPKIWEIQLSPFSGLLPALHSGTQGALCEAPVPLRRKEVYTRDVIPCLLWTTTMPNLRAAAAAKQTKPDLPIAKTYKLNNSVWFLWLFSCVRHISLTAPNPFKPQMSLVCSKHSFSFIFGHCWHLHYLSVLSLVTKAKDIFFDGKYTFPGFVRERKTSVLVCLLEWYLHKSRASQSPQESCQKKHLSSLQKNGNGKIICLFFNRRIF